MRPAKIIILLALILLALAAYFYVSKPSLTPVPKLETGDIAFRRENSFWGDIATSAARKEGKYSHSGVIVVEKGKIYVIHAYADVNSKQAEVAKQSLDEFLHNASAKGFYRLNFPAKIRTDIAKQALVYYNNRTPFDDNFSLEDDKKVYCTELVWRSIKTASGYDVAPIKSTMLGKAVIGNDDLYGGGFMQEVRAGQ